MARTALLTLLPLFAAATIVFAGHFVPVSGPFGGKPAESVFRVKADVTAIIVKSGPRTEDRTIGTIRNGTSVYDLNEERDGWRHIAGASWEGWILRSQLDGPGSVASGVQEADLLPS